MPRLAANLSMLFNEYPFPERFAAAARAGFKGVEFLFPYAYPSQTVAGWLHENELACVLFNTPAGNYEEGERGLTGVPGREAEFTAAFETALAYAKTLGTPRIHAMAGIVPQGATRAACTAVYIANLRRAARLARSCGITVMIEPINPRAMPGYLLQTQAEAHAVRALVDEPNLKVQMDLYHAQIVEGDLTTLLRRHMRDIGHIQIAGVPERHEPDTGELNLPYLLNLIDELGYDGWVGCEYRPRLTTEEGLHWLRAWER